MPTTNVYVKGTAKWCQLRAPDSWGSYKITLYPDGPSLERIREMQASGLKNVLKKDDDGYNVAFRRPQSKEMRGKIVTFTPPEVLGPDGKTPLLDLVGNGSEVTVKLEVYPHGTPGGGKAIAARLAAVKVDNLVPYDNTQKDQQAVVNEEPIF
jgi:hypothetical protein